MDGLLDYPYDFTSELCVVLGQDREQVDLRLVVAFQLLQRGAKGLG